MCRDLVFWILKPHISCRAFRLALKVREFIQALDLYVTYMIYDTIYDHRLSNIFLFLCRTVFTFWENLLRTQIDIVISTWELGGIRKWQGTFGGGVWSITLEWTFIYQIFSYHIFIWQHNTVYSEHGVWYLWFRAPWWALVFFSQLCIFCQDIWGP